MAIGDLSIGSIVASLRLDTGKFEKQIEKAKGGAAKLSSSIQKNSANIKRAGVGLTAFGAAAVGGIGLAVKSFATFEKGLAEIKTLGVTKSLDEIGDSVKKLSVEFGQDKSALIKAYYDSISAGVNEADIDKFLEQTAKLATAGATDIGTATDLMTTALNSFGLSAKDAEDVSDSMFTAVRLGKTTINEIAQAFGRVAPTAKGMGLSVDGINAAIAQLTKNGIVTSESMTGLKAALVNIQTPSEAARAAAKAMGIEFNAMALRGKGLVPFFSDLAKKTEEFIQKGDVAKLKTAALAGEFGNLANAQGELNTTGKRFFDVLDGIKNGTASAGDAMALLFGSSEALNTAFALTKNSGNDLTEAFGEFENKAGATEKAFDQMKDTVAFVFAQLREQFNNFKLTVGETFAPAAKMIAGLLSDGMSVVLSFAEVHPTLTKAIILAAGALGTMAAVLGPLLIVLPGVAAAVTAFTTSATIGGVAVAAAAASIAAFAAVFTAVLIPAVTTGVAFLKKWQNAAELAGAQASSKLKRSFNEVARALADTGKITEQQRAAMWKKIQNMDNGEIRENLGMLRRNGAAFAQAFTGIVKGAVDEQKKVTDEQVEGVKESSEAVKKGSEVQTETVKLSEEVIKAFLAQTSAQTKANTGFLQIYLNDLMEMKDGISTMLLTDTLGVYQQFLDKLGPLLDQLETKHNAAWRSMAESARVNLAFIREKLEGAVKASWYHDSMDRFALFTERGLGKAGEEFQKFRATVDAELGRVERRVRRPGARITPPRRPPDDEAVLHGERPGIVRRGRQQPPQRRRDEARILPIENRRDIEMRLQPIDLVIDGITLGRVMLDKFNGPLRRDMGIVTTNATALRGATP